MVSASFRYGDKEALVGEIRSIFGNDLAEVRLIDDEVMRESGEYYCFVNISEYEVHVESLIESTAVCRVVPTYDCPHEFSPQEVDDFGKSVDRAEVPEGFDIGDMVMLTNGELKGLYGIITKQAEHGHYIVAFRMCTRAFEEVIPVEDMEFVDNVFKHLKFPVTMDGIRSGDLHREGTGVMEALSKIVNLNKIRRKRRRIHKGGKS